MGVYKMNMKNRINIFLMVGIIALSIVGPSTALCNSNDTQPNNFQGSAIFALVNIECDNPEGFPEERYIGVLNNVNATLCGQSRLIVTPLPWIIYGTVFETDQPIHVTMEFYAGVIEPTQQPTMISGFTKNIIWEW
jgi:hypothetical protein